MELGLSDAEIGREVGISGSTVWRWRHRGFPVVPEPAEIHPDQWTNEKCADYSYLLGLYLGDGYIGTHARTHSLVIACDAHYENLVAECSDAVSTFSRVSPGIQYPKGTKGARVVSYGPLWPALFPQHGPGKTHERAVRLLAWQQEIVERHPRRFLRGLIHSDGSRCENRFTVQLKSGPREYSYPRYFFTNYSDDIRDLFCQSCDQLGIRWSQSNWRNISISHRDSVARLDSFVGPNPD